MKVLTCILIYLFIGVIAFLLMIRYEPKEEYLSDVADPLSVCIFYIMMWPVLLIALFFDYIQEKLIRHKFWERLFEKIRGDRNK